MNIYIALYHLNEKKVFAQEANAVDMTIQAETCI